MVFKGVALKKVKPILVISTSLESGSLLFGYFCFGKTKDQKFELSSYSDSIAAKQSPQAPDSIILFYFNFQGILLLFLIFFLSCFYIISVLFFLLR